MGADIDAAKATPGPKLREIHLAARGIDAQSEALQLFVPDEEFPVAGGGGIDGMNRSGFVGGSNS
jgi:hypothetical protein